MTCSDKIRISAWFSNTRDAELLVSFGEELAALVGLALAFLAVSSAWATGNPMCERPRQYRH